MSVELRRASEFSTAELAALFTAAYQGYFVPFKVDEQTLEYMVDAFDLLPAHSLVAAEAGAAVGLANLGLRGERAWVGGVGVVPARRGIGIGEQLMRALLDRARALGARALALEVITENGPAIALYEKLGFERTRELDVHSLALADTTGRVHEADAEAAQRTIERLRVSPEPWQRDDATLANLARRPAPPRGLLADGAAAVYRVDGGRVGLLQAAGAPAGLRALIDALRGRGQVSAVNFPTGGPVAAALRDAGAEVALRQLEMTTAL